MVRQLVILIQIAMLNTWAVHATLAAESAPTQIVQIVAPHSDQPKVMVAGGEGAGISIGDTMIVGRPLPLNDKDIVPTGKLKVFETFPDYAMAVIVSEGTDASRSAFPKFPNVMAGDLVSREKVDVANVPVLLPEMVIGFNKLFVDPSASPTNFEVSPEGKSQLEVVAQEYARAHMETLLIEAHTDENGPADANQIESYQRALTVRQYLISHFGFDEERVVAIGQGENEPIDDAFRPGHKDRARRIVFRVIR